MTKHYVKLQKLKKKAPSVGAIKILESAQSRRFCGDRIPWRALCSMSFRP